MLIAFNVVILCGLLVLLIAEERRHRMFRQRVQQTQEGLTTIALELRSPMSALRKYSSLLHTPGLGKLSVAQLECIGRMDEAVRSATVQIDRLLINSRLEEVALSGPQKAVDLGAGLRATVRVLEPIAEKRQHRLIVQAPRGLFVNMEPLILHGIFDELILNAIAYTPKRGTIKISAKRMGNKISINIEDPGIGISKAEKLHVFEAFFRGERARNLFAGNGLGLAFAKNFTERSKGTINFRSKENKGTVFTVTLPTSK